MSEEKAELSIVNLFREELKQCLSTAFQVISKLETEKLRKLMEDDKCFTCMLQNKMNAYTLSLGISQNHEKEKTSKAKRVKK